MTGYSSIEEYVYSIYSVADLRALIAPYAYLHTNNKVKRDGERGRERGGREKGERWVIEGREEGKRGVRVRKKRERERDREREKKKGGEKREHSYAIYTLTTV